MKTICPKCNHEFLTKDNTKKVLDLLRNKGSLNISEISRSLGISRPATYHHIKKLKKMGLIKTFRIKIKFKAPKGNPLFVSLKNGNKRRI